MCHGLYLQHLSCKTTQAGGGGGGQIRELKLDMRGHSILSSTSGKSLVSITLAILKLIFYLFKLLLIGLR